MELYSGGESEVESGENILMSMARRETGEVGRSEYTPLALNNSRPVLDDRLTADYTDVSVFTFCVSGHLIFPAPTTDAETMAATR